MNILFLVPTYGTFKEIIEPTALLHKQITVMSYDQDSRSSVKNTLEHIRNAMSKGGADVMVICLPHNATFNHIKKAGIVAMIPFALYKTCIIHASCIKDLGLIKDLTTDLTLLQTITTDDFLLTLAEVTQAQGLLKSSTN